MMGSPYQRLLDNEYDDRISFPRTKSKYYGISLPPSRFVSQTVSNNLSKEHPTLTALFVAIGQFIDHDFDHAPVMRKYFMYPGLLKIS